MKMIRRLEHFSCEDRLRGLGAVQHGGHLIAACQHLRGVYKKAGEALLTKACSNRKWDNGFILKEVIF